MTQENDEFKIPKKYLKMSVAELETAQAKLLTKLKKGTEHSQTKIDKKNSTNISFNL